MGASDVTRFAVVRFVPDPVRDERLNIGVVAISGDGLSVGSRFMKDWRRVQRFAPGQVELAKQFVADLQSYLPDEGTPLGQDLLSLDELARMSADFRNCVQVSSPKASLLDMQTVLEEEFARFVGGEVAAEARTQPKRELYNRARESLEARLVERFETPDVAEELLKRREMVRGKHAGHNFGIALRNGCLYAAATAISFAIDKSDVQRDMGSAAWDITDVVAASSVPHLAVLLGDPADNRCAKEMYMDARRLFGELDAEVVEENGLDAWATRVVDLLPDNVALS